MFTFPGMMNEVIHPRKQNQDAAHLSLLLCTALLLLVILLPHASLQARTLTRRGWRYHALHGLSHQNLARCCRVTDSLRRKLGRDFPVLHGMSLKVYCSSQTFAPNSGAQGTAYAGGYYFPARKLLIIQHVPRLVRQQRLRTIIAHELVHAALHELGPHSLPLWLEEGCAVYFSGEKIAPESPPGRGARSLAELNRGLQKAARRGDFASWQQSRVLYRQARLLLIRIISRSGRTALFSLLDALSQGADLPTALKKHTGLDRERLEAFLAEAADE